MPGPALAVLDLYRLLDGYSRDDTALRVAAEARAAGASVRVAESVQGDSDEAEWHALLARWVAAERCDVLVLLRAWSGATVETLRVAAPDARLVRVTRDVAAALDDAFDHVVDNKGLSALVRGETPEPARFAPTNARALREAAAAAAESGSAPAPTDGISIVRLGGGSSSLDRATITGPAVGCPFLRDSLRNPHFASLDLDPRAIQTRGCTFCLDNYGAYRVVPEAEVVASWMAQLRAIRAERPEVREVLLTDELPHPYLPALFTAIAEAPELGGFELLVKSRVDWLLEHADGALSRAAEAAERSGSVLHLYLVGFESFDPFHLELFNKGVTVADNIAAVATLHELAKRYPRSFECFRSRAHGIVLFTPWTRPEHLIENARVMRAVDFDKLRTHALSTRLRLYPRVPLYVKAQADGLLAERFEEERGDRAAEQGYDASVPWRFADPRTELASAICRSPLVRVLCEQGRLREHDALELAAVWATEWPRWAPGHETDSGACAALFFDLVGRSPFLGMAREAWAPLAFFDAELEGMRAGLRRGALREGVPWSMSADLIRAYELIGLRAGVTPPGAVQPAGAGNTGTGADAAERCTVAVATDEASLDELRRAHGAIIEHRGDSTVMLAVGRILGYPACCSDAFVGHLHQGQDDNQQLELAPFRRRAAPLPPLNNRITLPGALFSHHLCTPDCAATEALAGALLGRLESLLPGAAARLVEKLRRPLLFAGYDRRVVYTEAQATSEGYEVGGAELIAAWGFSGDERSMLARATRVVPRPERVDCWAGDERLGRVHARNPLFIVPGEALSAGTIEALKPLPGGARHGVGRGSEQRAVAEGEAVPTEHIEAVRRLLERLRAELAPPTEIGGGWSAVAVDLGRDGRCVDLTLRYGEAELVVSAEPTRPGVRSYIEAHGVSLSHYPLSGSLAGADVDAAMRGLALSLAR
jgi:hypothetical protein